jgi:hypothetical protein
MKAGQITAKLRDAVPVHFFENGEDRIQYKNIEIPDSLKALEIMDFGFDVPVEGKISFRLFFDNGILPAEFPPARPMMTRAAKMAAKIAKAAEVVIGETATEEATSEEAAEVITAEAIDGETTDDTESAAESLETPEQPTLPETMFNVAGSARKALVAAISQYLNQQSEYLGAPSYAYAIGSFRIDKNGTLLGEASPEMLTALAEQGFSPENSDDAA